jgi:hypothetical protein
MSRRAKTFLLLTIVGFITPNVMLGVHLAEHGLDIGNYLGDWFGTLPAAQIAIDLFIVAVAFLTWAAWDGPRAGVTNWWVVFPSTFLVGACFAVPLYLFMRERAATAT